MADYDAFRHDIPAPTLDLLAIYVKFRGQTISTPAAYVASGNWETPSNYNTFSGQKIVIPIAYVSSGYLDTSLGKPAHGGSSGSSGSNRPLTGWLWPRT